MRRDATPAPTSCTASSCAETRQRLLDAASLVFAERGYREATVREICQRAGANVAAVNYHFGDKEQLYLEVLRHGARIAHERYPLIRDLDDPAITPQQHLAAFVLALIKRIFDPDAIATHGRLMAREMIDPTPAIDVLIEETMRPCSEMLRHLLHQLLGREASDELVWHCIGSIVGQCVYYKHCRPLLARLRPELRFDLAELEALANHITAFSLGALGALAQPQTPLPAAVRPPAARKSTPRKSAAAKVR